MSEQEMKFEKGRLYVKNFPNYGSMLLMICVGARTMLIIAESDIFWSNPTIDLFQEHPLWQE